MMKKIGLLIVLIFIFVSCGGQKKVVLKKVPKSVRCNKDDGCKANDPFVANIDNIKRCLSTGYPIAIKNYDGYSILIPGVSLMMNQSEAIVSKLMSVAIPMYFKILSDIYYEDYKDSIEKDIASFSSYKEEISSVDKNNPRERVIIEKIMTSAEINGITSLTSTKLDKKSIICKYFNVSRFLSKNINAKLPKSFELNIESLLMKTTDRFNKEMREDKFDLKKMNLKFKDEEFPFTQEYEMIPEI